MTNQLQLFSSLRPIKRQAIKVGGGRLYSDQRGVVRVKVNNGSTILKDVLFVPQLGVNLLSGKRVCENGLRGNFDNNAMYYTRDNKTIIKASIKNGLYVGFTTR